MRRLLYYFLLVLLAASCASIGRPDGGPRDETPPVFVSSTPAPGAVDVTPHRMIVNFNENIQLEDAFNKVVSSPPSKNVPTVRANGRRMTVEFRDSLLPNTTYTIDFADAIKDLNEGNILDGFALDFSTGPTLDSLRISGIVLDAQTLEPQQGMLVGVHTETDSVDSALMSRPFERIARTNQYGQFTVRGLAPGRYRVYALDDVNRDYMWDRSEVVGFYPVSVSPSVEEIAVSDTLYASTGEDSVAVRGGVHFLPDDILLSTFSLGYSPQYVKDYKRPERRRVNINFAAAADSLARLAIVDGVPDSLRGLEWPAWALMHPNATRDTLDFWVTDPAVMAADSLRLALSYMKEDSARNMVWTTDTLRFFFREPRDTKKPVKDAEADTIPPVHDALGVRPSSGSVQELHLPFAFEVSEPLATIDSAAVRIEIQRDTLWMPVADGRTLSPDTVNPLLARVFDIKWEPGARYRFNVDSAAMVSVYGEHNKAMTSEFTVKNKDDYSTLVFRLDGLDDLPAVVELLSTSDQPVYRTAVPAGGRDATFTFLAPGTYYARLYIDENANGRWDTGNPETQLQPEETFYYPKKIELKKNWDIDQNWDIAAEPLDSQKPRAIKKNKPKLKRGEREPIDEDDDGFGYEQENYNPFGGSGSRNSNRGGGNRRPSGGGFRNSNTSGLRR
ncbi:MAG: Ig-like domain-containing protein [Muribaculaceae bacterium]|nr:Ig-like domain-containing protein [Muribaculaceae bacterium]